MVGWFPYHFTTRNVYPVPALCSKQRREYPESKPCSRFSLLVRDSGDWMTDATERGKRKTDRANSERRRRKNGDVKSKGKGAKEKACG